MGIQSIFAVCSSAEPEQAASEGDEARHGEASLSSNHDTVDVTDLPIIAHA
jgi:hypothetical protein